MTFLKSPLTVVAACALSACTITRTAQSPITGEVTVAVQPREVHVVRGHDGQHLNLDFIITNGTRDKLVLNKIELSVFDSAGKLARREFYDEYGRKTLEMTPAATLRSGRTQLIVNPFHSFGADVPLHRLHVEFSFRTTDREKETRTSVDLAPVVYEPKTPLVLPIRGRVLVWDGHDYNAHHRRNLIRGGLHSRYSYDFVVVDERGSIHKGRPRANDDWYQQRPDDWADYYGFGVPVHATGAGRVVQVRDLKPDDRKFDEREFATDDNSPAGNYVVIDHLNGEFSFFGHIKQGSARVKVGQMVQQGDTIAAMGASGSSLFPHLHYELRTGPGTQNVEGLPSYFTNFRRILGSRSIDVQKGAINTGDLVESR